ncbi:MAG: tRNA (N(6)-L-threonylcarbamoyladenosine(37)-C(2))-methylthiotransferase MtaB [Vampirovibrionales bacterium]|nr:tRNA (N(6)-L-threonylcarbamoyladenosine(37)-C(2))-methylthiotransferase MtaB [Vampirovibrionales bacterium]
MPVLPDSADVRPDLSFSPASARLAVPALVDGNHKRVAFITLGCRANQVESSALAEQFKQLGWQIVPEQESAALYVVNTCTVTEQADAEARRLIRKRKREHPEARFAVTGCYAQIAPKPLAALEGVDFVIGNALKDQLAALVDERFWTGRPAEPWIMIDELDKSRVLAATGGASHLSRHRASLKIQDGCDYKCTYCIIWQARGPSISVPAKSVVQTAQRLRAEGYNEIVLTGINIGQYLCPETGADFAALLVMLTQAFTQPDASQRVRFRLSSLDPLEVTPAVIAAIADSGGVICPFLHLSAQSVDDGVLKAMARRHHVDEFEQIVTRFNAALPHAMISADIIVGFPGETDAAFNLTHERLARLPVHCLHVFRYSPRPGTPAALYKPQVPERIRKQRAEKLLALSRQKRVAFAQSMHGQTRLVLIEAQTEQGDWQGTSECYLKVCVAAEGLPTALEAGQVLNVVLMPAEPQAAAFDAKGTCV